jgi:hypothetical protein
MTSGAHPAMTAFTAMFHGVAARFADGSTAIASPAARRVWARNCSTRGIVGGTIGKPSLHSFEWK